MTEHDAADAPTEGRPRAPLTSAQKRWLVAILVVAAVARIGWLAYAHVEPPTSFAPAGDPYSYWYYGNELARGNGYDSFLTGEPTAYYPVGFPAALAVVYWLANHTPFVDPDLMVVTGLFQVALSVATVALTFVVGRRLAGPRAGLAAAGVMALFPNLVHQVTTIQVETTFIFLTMAALAILVDHDWRSGPPSRGRLLAFGAVLAASAMVRPFSAPLLLGLVLALLAIGVGWRRAAALLALPVVVLVVVFAPWTIRNAVEMDGFVPSSTNMGDTLCLDRNEDATGGFRFTVHDGCVSSEMAEAPRNSANTRRAIGWVIDNPGRELVQIVRRARLIFEHDHDGIASTELLGSGPVLSDRSRSLNVTVADWYFRVVLVAGLVGLPLLYRRSPRPERRIVAVILVTLLVIPVLLWGNPRFHQPLVPFMALSAGALVAAAGERAGRLRLARRGSAGGPDEDAPPPAARDEQVQEPADVGAGRH